jgi:hypothetical protein
MAWKPSTTRCCRIVLFVEEVLFALREAALMTQKINVQQQGGGGLQKSTKQKYCCCEMSESTC